jgi:transcription elongation factor Elf1
MAETVKVCNCEKCGNEAEMTITCKTVNVEELSGVKKKMQQETRVCTVCGNEANMLIDFGS